MPIMQRQAVWNWKALIINEEIKQGKKVGEIRPFSFGIISFGIVHFKVI